MFYEMNLFVRLQIELKGEEWGLIGNGRDRAAETGGDRYNGWGDCRWDIADGYVAIGRY